MKKVLQIALLLLCANISKAQTVHEDPVNQLSYVNISPVVWQYGQPACNRLYISSYSGDMVTSANVIAHVGFLSAPDTWANFIVPQINYIFTGLQYDSVRTYGKTYIFRTIARGRGLTIAD